MLPRAARLRVGVEHHVVDAALAQGGALDPLRDHGADAVAAWLGDAPGGQGGTIELAVASDDPDDLTLRTARLLGSADPIAHERGVAVAVLDRARADAVRLPIAAGESAPGRPGLTIVLRR